MSQEGIDENPNIEPVTWRDPSVSTAYNDEARDPYYIKHVHLLYTMKKSLFVFIHTLLQTLTIKRYVSTLKF